MSQTQKLLKVNTKASTAGAESIKSYSVPMSHNMILFSKSELKLQAVNSYIDQYGMNCTEALHNTTTDTEQPFGVDNTYACAMQRFTSDKSSRFLISIENGIYVVDDIVKDMCVVIIKDNVTGKTYDNKDMINETSIEVPEGDILLEKAQESKSDSGLGFNVTLGSMLAKKHKVPKNNWMGHMTGTSRSKQIEIALDSLWSILMRETVLSHVRLINGFPNEKVLFQDYMPVLYHNTSRAFLTQLLINEIPKDIKVDILAGPEMRGIIFGQSMADKMRLGIIPLRKKGKLPPPTSEKCYSTEYKPENTLEMDISTSNPLCTVKGMNVVIIDDVKATGGSLKAGIELIERAGGKVVYWITINEVSPLRNVSDEILENYPGSVVFK